MAHPHDTVEKPQDWEKAVSAAYMRLLGAPQRVAAEAADIGARTLIRWEKSDWWPKALEEANDRWFHRLTSASRRTLLKAIRKGRSDQALTVLERVDPRLMPPKQRHELSGPDGGAIPTEVTVTRRVIRPDGDDRA